jgi:hypothetical protein
MDVMNMIQDVNYNIFSNWRSGCYHWQTGIYMEYPSRLCLNDYVICKGGVKYTITFSDINYRALIRELDVNYKFLGSYVIPSTETFTTKINTHYLAIGIYHPNNSKMTYTDYSNLFSEGFTFSIRQVYEDDNIINNVEDVDFTSISNWRSGCYNLATGIYERNNARMCLTNYKLHRNLKYIVKINEESFHMLIRELDENKGLIKSYNLGNDEEYSPDPKAKYLAIGVYRATGERGLSFSFYEQLLANGFVAELREMASSNIMDVNSTISAINLYDEIKEMLETGDQNTRDVSKYHVKWLDYYQIYNDLIENECYVAAVTYYSMSPKTTRDSHEILQTITLSGADKGFPERYKRMKRIIKHVLSRVTEDMSDIEKALIAHDYVVEHTVYDNTAVAPYSASAALVNGKAICSGYTQALNVLLHEMGVVAHYLPSTPMNHGWSMAVLDGELYHIDATWDDTLSRKIKQTDHTFFVRNDEQFMNANIMIKRHYGWKSYTFNAASTSTKYNTWFCHDVLGKIACINSKWYYAEGNLIKRAKIDGTLMEVIRTESAAITIEFVLNNMIVYSMNGIIKYIVIYP